MDEEQETILPHNPKCACEVCVSNRNDLQYENKRLQLYRQTTSIEFFRDVFEHPFSAAVDHCADLREASQSTNIHRKSYAVLYNDMCTILQDLMEDEEVEMNHLLDTGETINHEPRVLRRLLDQENVEVITHFKMQHWLNRRWEAEIADYTWIVRWLFLASVWLFLPLFSVLGAFQIRFTKAPRLRWHSHLVSHIFFLILLLNRLFWGERENSLRSARINNVFALDLLINLFVLSHFMILMVRISHRGIKSFMRDWWNWVEMGIVINGINFFVASSNIELQRQSGLPMELHRRHIPSTDHLFVCDISLSLMILFVIVRFAYFMQMTDLFGKFIVAVSRCAGEYLRYLLLLFIFVMGFAFAAYGILHPVATTPDDRSRGFTKNMGFQVYSDNFLDTAANLYWNLLSLLDGGYVQLHAGFAGPDQTPVPQDLSRLFLRVLMAFFLLFIALATRAESCKENGDENWAFARTSIVVDYFNDEMAAPPPFTFLVLLLVFIRKIKTLVEKIA